MNNDELLVEREQLKQEGIALQAHLSKSQNSPDHYAKLPYYPRKGLDIREASERREKLVARYSEVCARLAEIKGQIQEIEYRRMRARQDIPKEVRIKGFEGFFRDAAKSILPDNLYQQVNDIAGVLYRASLGEKE